MSPFARSLLPPRHVRHLLVAAAAALLLGAFGCSPKGDGTPKTRVIKLGYAMAPVGAVHEASERFAELVAQKTGGRVTVKIFPSASLGNERELAEGLTFGSVDLVLAGFAAISGFVPEYELLEAPFMFRDYDHERHVLEGAIGQEVDTRLAEVKGIRILGWWLRGPRYLTANRPVRTPDDLKGLKLRVPELQAYIEAWRILGANTTPLTYSEVFMALKQGTVEGQENPLEVIYTSSLQEVQSHLMDTRHQYSAYMMMAGERFLAQLAPEDRQAVTEAVKEAGDYGLELVKKYDADYLAKLREKGMQVVETDRDAFRKKVHEQLPGRFEGKWKAGLFQRIQEVP